jgi:hypothetical protein
MSALQKVRTSIILMCMDAQHAKHVTSKLAYYYIISGENKDLATGISVSSQGKS